MTIYNLISFIGIFVLAFVAWLLSSDRKTVNWRVVAWGIGLQLLFAFFLFVVPAGTKVFLFFNDVVVKVLDSAQAGTRFFSAGWPCLPARRTNPAKLPSATSSVPGLGDDHLFCRPDRRPLPRRDHALFHPPLRPSLHQDHGDQRGGIPERLEQHLRRRRIVARGQAPSFGYDPVRADHDHHRGHGDDRFDRPGRVRHVSPTGCCRRSPDTSFRPRSSPHPPRSSWPSSSCPRPAGRGRSVWRSSPTTSARTISWSPSSTGPTTA